jgi:ankyrin repeat protein
MEVYMKKHSTFILAGLVFLPVFPMENTSKTELHTAAANSSLKNKVQKIIESNPVQIHQKDGDGNTPLHEAAYYGCTENADLLLWQASGNFDYEKMLDLLKRGANPNAMHDDGSGVKMTPLARIARSADYTTPHKVMQVLLDYGANINLEDSAGWTPYGRTSQGADSQTGDSIGKFFSQRNARFKKGSI